VSKSELCFSINKRFSFTPIDFFIFIIDSINLESAVRN
jgi:hypothetical protein